MLDTPDCDETVCPGKPGAAMLAVAERLASYGFEVRVRETGESRCLEVTSMDSARCELSVEDCGCVMWEYRHPDRGRAHPADVAALVTGVLGADNGDEQATVRGPANLPLKGAVGRELRTRGLDVCMSVYEDLVFYEVNADIVVANPARPERGRVHLDDEGGVLWEWEWDYHRMAAGDAVEVADVIAAAIGTEGTGKRELART